MKSSTDFKLDKSVAILLVGEPKTGKTCLMAAFPGLYVLDCDMNLASAIRRGFKDFSYDQPNVDDKGGERPLKDRWKFSIKALKEACTSPSIRTVCIDGLGVFCEYLVEHVHQANITAGTCKTGKMELQMWGEVGRLLRETMMMLRSSGKIILVTSHQTSEKDEHTGVISYRLAIPGASKETLGGLFTDVWATTAKPSGTGYKFEIRTKPTGLHVALGTSFPLASSVDVTDKQTPAIWSLLAPSLGLA